jgi:hypothetical protein
VEAVFGRGDIIVCAASVSIQAVAKLPATSREAVSQP